MSADDPAVGPAQTWFALEQEAVWVYGLIGARVRDLRDDALAQLAAHEVVRDRLASRLIDLGARPAAPQASYDVRTPDNAKSGRALARTVEARIAAACARLVAVTFDEDRADAVRGLRTAALARVSWGGTPEPFPGLD